MEPRTDDTDHLFRRWRARGEPGALAELFDRAAPRLLRFAIHLVGDASAAEDLVQATFLALIEQRERIDAARPIGPWLTGVLANKARELRRSARRVVDPAQLEQRLVEDAAASAERRELHGEVARAIDQLDEPYRQVVLLSLRHAMAPADIAHVLGRDAGAVRVQLHRGLQKLRKSLPAALASSLMLAVTAPRGLAAVKAQVLDQALLATPAATGATLLGGLLVSKLAVVAAAAVVAALAWFMSSNAGDAARAPVFPASDAAALAAAREAPPARETLAEPPVASRGRAEIAATAPSTSTHALEVVDALTKLPLAGASVALHPARNTDVRALLRERPEAFSMNASGRLEARSQADWPALAGALDTSFAGRAPLLAQDLPGDAAPFARATSDSRGRAALTAMDTRGLLEAALEGYATRYRPIDAGALPPRVELWPLHRVRGRCFLTGRPYSGAPLELAVFATAPGADGERREGVCVERVRTDQAGRFSVALGGERGHVRVLSPGWSIAQEVRMSLDDSEWRIELQAQQVVRVLDAADGSPLEWMHVLGQHPQIGFVVWSSIAHAPGGLLTLPGMAGRPGFQGHVRFKLWAPGYAPQFVDESAKPSTTPIELRFQRDPTPALAGRVLEAGAPLDGSTVSLFAHASNLMWSSDSTFHSMLVDATTSVNGRFELLAPPGVYLLSITHDSQHHARVIEHPAPQAPEIDLARLASLEVVVVDRSGAPQAGHVVAIDASDRRTARRHADEHGIARFEKLPSLQVSVAAPNSNTTGSFDPDVQEEVVLGEGEQLRVTLVVRGVSAPRRMRVVARGTSDYSGWRTRFGEQSWEELSLHGVIPMDLATAEWTAEVVALDGRHWSFDIPKDARDGHVIELDGGEGRLHGIVRVPSGAPLAGWWIEAQPWGDCTNASAARARRELTAAGRFEFSGLAECAHRLRLYDHDSKLRAEFTPARPPASDSRSLEILLDPPQGELRLSGVVRRTSGSPVAGALVLIESTTPGADGALQIHGPEPLARTDEQGRYSIALPRMAQHEISVFAEQNRSRAALVTVLDDGRSERELDLEID